MNLLAGATGFLGNEILYELSLLQDQTLVLTRRKIDTLPMNTDQMIIDFNKISELELPQIDHVFLSIGFPLFFHNVMGIMNKNLKKDLFLVDLSYQLEIAKKAKETGAKNISIISAVGANPNSWNYYLKIKGMVEKELINIGFDSTNIFQPGHLRGNKYRFDILLADMASIFCDPFLLGPLTKFRSISAKAVAKHVVNNSLKSEPGTNYFDFIDFQPWR
tara:strand:+ start:522 stop:1178 length:657 start_codon:yes stop_codon:yes gene_type:complete